MGRLDYTGGSWWCGHCVVEWVLLDNRFADRGQLALGSQKKRAGDGVHRRKIGREDY